MPDEPNPYASPQHANDPLPATMPPTREQVRRLLWLPAMAMVTSAILSFLILAGWLVMALLRSARFHHSWHDIAWLVALVVACSFASYKTLLGGLAMLRLVDYRAALQGVWYAFLPCNISWVLALPFAAYADWQLRRPEVYAAFSPERIRLFSRWKPDATS